ncbi:MAG: MIP family channel protein [Nitrospirae bacterium]|nr:MIP family channel protein [Nitrospirota bacterium]MBI3351847.1 MIP family channel protein [Nitrospirota bacterium]
MPVHTRESLRSCLAEFTGTFFLVLAGCGALVIDQIVPGQITHVGIALTFGLAVMAMIYATGHLSGAHLNPAVTLGFAFCRHFAWKKILPYWLAQILGALAAALVLKGLFGNVGHLGTTLPQYGLWQTFFLEFFLTFFLMFVIMAVATDSRAVGEAAAIAIGGTVGMEALFAGPISGASMNPARSLGPALVSGTLEHLWVYLLAPLTGAVLGAFFYQLIKGDHQPKRFS